jgi:hypothetical protein
MKLLEDQRRARSRGARRDGLPFHVALAHDPDFRSPSAFVGFLDNVVVEFGQVREMVFAQESPLGNGNTGLLKDPVFLNLAKWISAEESSANPRPMSDERRRKNQGWVLRKAKVHGRRITCHKHSGARINLADASGDPCKTCPVESLVYHDHQIAWARTKETRGSARAEES